MVTECLLIRSMLIKVYVHVHDIYSYNSVQELFCISDYMNIILSLQ